MWNNYFIWLINCLLSTFPIHTDFYAQLNALKQLRIQQVVRWEGVLIA